jgi:hypothetical protein
MYFSTGCVLVAPIFGKIGGANRAVVLQIDIIEEDQSVRYVTRLVW